MHEWALRHKRLVVTVILLLFILILIARHIVFPSLNDLGEVDWATTIRAVLDALISAIVVSFFVSFTLWWVSPPSQRIPPGYELPAIEISKNLRAHAANTDEWEYVGHTARYVRTKILPLVIDQSRRENSPCRLRVIILDPNIDTLCKAYADYRNRSRSIEFFSEDGQS